MAALARALTRYFRVTIRRRGFDYYHGGRVTIETSSAAYLTATVEGGAAYRVVLRRNGDVLTAACDCAYFEPEMCKHVWAVVLAADAAELLQGEGAERLRLISAGSRRGGVGGSAAADDLDDIDDIDDVEDVEDIDDVDARDGLGESAGAARASGVEPPPHSAGGPPHSAAAPWRRLLGQVGAAQRPFAAPVRPWPAGRILLYVIDAAASLAAPGLNLELFQQDLKKDGTRAKPKARGVPREQLPHLPDADDRSILAFLAGATQLYGDSGYGYGTASEAHWYPYRYRLVDPQPAMLLPAMCRTGRCHLRVGPRDDAAEWLPLAWDDGEPWHFRLEVRPAADGDRYLVSGALVRGDERLDIATPALLTSSGFFFMRGRAARFEHHGAFDWIALLRRHGAFAVPAAQRDDFLAELFTRTAFPALDLPRELRYTEVLVTPRPRLSVKPAEQLWRRQDFVAGELSFDYAGTVVAAEPRTRAVVRREERRLLLRDFAAEGAARARLVELGWRVPTGFYQTGREPSLELANKRFPETVRELLAAGWHVTAEGKVYRSAGRLELRVGSGIDWLELHGRAAFGDAELPLPELLAAVRRGERTVTLDDGSQGLLPEEWLDRYRALAQLGTAQGDHVRFGRSQGALLDALLAAEPEVSWDETSARVRAELTKFTRVKPAAAPKSFRGKLRAYQKEGLGWFGFLREFGFGGCLADDMGLGKTVQVLALLEGRRVARAAEHPSLVVVPKSLIFNWRQEAERFAPRLRVLDHTGAQRGAPARFADYDLVLTTYGTLRNDAAKLSGVRFDYVILDEAQAIKNASSASAKAVRLLKAEHRLALSGTPIENHLSELWSLFEFLNPGMLGSATVFKALSAADDDTTRPLLARAVRPFLLRRTKAQVLAELPPKVEQTLYCEMEPRQRKLYDELRDHYRGALLQRIERDGIQRAKIQILEALLRLRQAALHPGLLDERRVGEQSAKLEMLLPQLAEVLDEGHKTLVFSQFTSMLAILRRRLDEEGVTYEYLDGQTRDREARVARFQNDAQCKLFLISLKAGGLGLNLTAAQYVYLLDPWWNPAVEAQAIDRAHRIGQTASVFAYRLIVRDTIEERVVELQQAKRALADAIIGADNAMLRTLSKEDLELLLS